MTVAELIKKLQTLPLDATIDIYVSHSWIYGSKFSSSKILDIFEEDDIYYLDADIR